MVGTSKAVLISGTECFRQNKGKLGDRVSSSVDASGRFILGFQGGVKP